MNFIPFVIFPSRAHIITGRAPTEFLITSNCGIYIFIFLLHNLHRTRGDCHPHGHAVVFCEPHMANGLSAADSFASLRENEANKQRKKKIKEKMKNKFSHFRTMCEYYEYIFECLWFCLNLLHFV